MRRLAKPMLSVLAVLLVLGASGAAAAPATLRADPLVEDPDFERTAWGYQRKDLALDTSRRWPTLFEMEGYAGAGVPNAYLELDDGVLLALNISFGKGPTGDYAVVLGSIRGTNCSGGNFNLYDRRHAWDGHQVIEWIADQPWSNERVGMHGSSYSGQTAYWVATTQPPSLKAISANALHSDIYRDIFMPGGVQNYLFPIAWTYGTGPDRLPTEAYNRGALAADGICQSNQTGRYSAGDLPQPQQEPAWAAIGATDNDWYAAHAALTYAPAITIPYYQQNNWQDEQTGPRAAVLFNHIHPTPREIVDRHGQRRTVVPKKLVTSSGDHGWGKFHDRDLWAFLDIWLRDLPDRNGLYDALVENYFETREDRPGSAYTAVKTGDTWPFEDTRWERLHLRAGGRLDPAAPGGPEAPDRYASGVGRQGWFWYAPTTGTDVTWAQGLPDAVGYRSEALAEDLVVAGPILVNLKAALSGTDTDFFVSIADVSPDGSVSYLQRGMLKASHRRVDPRRSYYAADGTLVQPYRPHTNPQPVVPGAVEEYLIEVFPLGHIFRAGHRIQIQVHTPPAVDGLWGYTPTHHQPGVVTVHHDAAAPSWIQLPVVEPDGPLGEAPAGCRVPGGFPCVKPAA